MTLVEIFIVGVFIFLVYLALGPIQRKIERKILNMTKKSRRSADYADLIDITNYKSDSQNKEKH